MEVNFLEIFKNYKSLILSAVLIAIIVSVIVIFNTPPFYQVSAKIYPKEYDNIKILYEAIKTKEILNGVIDDAGLVKSFEVENRDQARKKLVSILKVILDSRNNIIEIRIKWKNPEQAAMIVNFFIKQLQENYPAPLASAEIKSRITIYENSLKSAEERLGILKEKESQLFGDDSRPLKIVRQIAYLRGEIAAKEQILNNLEIFKSIENSHLELRSLRKVLDDYIYNTSPPHKRIDRYFYLNNFEQLEAELTAYKNLLNQAKTQKALSLNWQVIEWPVIPEEPVGPDRIKTIVFTALVSLLSALFLTFLIEVFRKRQI